MAPLDPPLQTFENENVSWNNKKMNNITSYQLRSFNIFDQNEFLKRMNPTCQNKENRNFLYNLMEKCFWPVKLKNIYKSAKGIKKTYLHVK